MNHSALSALIQSTTENNDPTFVANIDRFIQTAERRIYSEVRMPETRKALTTTTAIGNRDITLPGDCVSIKEIFISVTGANVPLLPKSPGFLESMYPTSAATSVPKYYIQDSPTLIKVAPTPAAAYTTTITYFGYPTSIVTSGTTWLGDNFDHLLLYACLLEAYVFMKGSTDIMAYYKTAYDAGLAELQKSIQPVRQDNFRER